MPLLPVSASPWWGEAARCVRGGGLGRSKPQTAQGLRLLLHTGDHLSLGLSVMEGGRVDRCSAGQLCWVDRNILHCGEEHNEQQLWTSSSFFLCFLTIFSPPQGLLLLLAILFPSYIYEFWYWWSFGAHCETVCICVCDPATATTTTLLAAAVEFPVDVWMHPSTDKVYIYFMLLYMCVSLFHLLYPLNFLFNSTLSKFCLNQLYLPLPAADLSLNSLSSSWESIQFVLVVLRRGGRRSGEGQIAFIEMSRATLPDIFSLLPSSHLFLVIIVTISKLGQVF